MAHPRALLVAALFVLAVLAAAPRGAAANKIRCGDCTCRSSGATVRCVQGQCVLQDAGGGNSATSLSMECSDGAGTSSSSSSSQQQYAGGGQQAGWQGAYAGPASNAAGSYAQGATAWALGAAASTFAAGAFGDAFEW